MTKYSDWFDPFLLISICIFVKLRTDRSTGQPPDIHQTESRQRTEDMDSGAEDMDSAVHQCLFMYAELCVPKPLEDCFCCF